MSTQSRNIEVSDVWKLTDHQATLCCGKLIGNLDVSSPKLGLSEVEFDGHPFSGSLWGFEFPAEHPVELKEAYLRGHDLVAHYLASDAYPFDLYCYWNVQPLEDNLGTLIRLTISWQTDLLDTDPELVLKTTWPGDFKVVSGDNQYLLRSVANAVGYELPHPSDMANCEFTDEGHQKVDLPFLEKGVIRRARFATILLPSSTEASLAAKAIEEFCLEPLPLTT